MRHFGSWKVIQTKDCYRSPHLAAHRECTSSGAALLWGQGLFACYVQLIFGQWWYQVREGKRKATVEWGQPPAVRGSEDRRQVLPVLVSCQKEAGPLILSWLQRRNSIGGRTSWQKIRTEAAAGWEANCCHHWNFMECLTKKGHFFLLFDLFLVEVNTICAMEWPFHVHFQLRA